MGGVRLAQGGIIGNEYIVAILHHGHEIELLMERLLRPAAAEIGVAADMVVEGAGEGEARPYCLR